MAQVLATRSTSQLLDVAVKPADADDGDNLAVTSHPRKLSLLKLSSSAKDLKALKKPSPIANRKLVLNKKSPVQRTTPSSDKVLMSSRYAFPSKEDDKPASEKAPNLSDGQQHLNNNITSSKASPKAVKSAVIRHGKDKLQAKAAVYDVSKKKLIKELPSDMATSTSCSTELKTIVLKKGWIYKKGPHFFSKWHAKWAVLKQQVPPTVSLPNSGNDIDISPVQVLVSGIDHTSNPSSAIKSSSPILEIYEDRSHMEAKLPPKHVLSLNSDSVVTSLDRLPKSKKYYWNVKTEAKDDQNSSFAFSTYSEAEKANWLLWLNQVKNPLWYLDIAKKKELQRKSIIKKSTVVDELAAMKEPSAPSKAELKMKEAMTTQPRVPPLVIPTSKGEDGAGICFAGKTLYSQAELDEILVNPSINMVVNNNKTTSLETMKNRKWNFEYQAYISTLSQCTPEEMFLKGFYSFMGEFKRIAIELAVKYVDELHTKASTFIEPFKFGELLVAPICDYLNDDDWTIERAEKQVDLDIEAIQFIHALRKSDSCRSPLNWVVSYKGFKVKVGSQVDLSADSSFTNDFNIEAKHDATTGFTYLEYPRDLIEHHEHEGQASELNIRCEWRVICGGWTDQDTKAAALGLLKEKQLPLVAKKLDNLDILTWESIILSEFLHTHGVSIWQLGQLFGLVAMPHSKELLLLEMLSRAFKNHLNLRLRREILQFRRMRATCIDSELFAAVALEYTTLLKNPAFLLSEVERRFKLTLAVDDFSMLESWRLFCACNLQTGIQWGTDAVPLVLEKMPLAGCHVSSFTVREKGSLKEFELYGFMRQNEWRGFYGLGLLKAVNATGTIDMLTNDLLIPSNNNLEASDISHSPLELYFTSCLAINNDKPTGSGNAAVLALGPASMASLFFSLNPLSETGVNCDTRKAWWFYILAVQNLYYNTSAKRGSLDTIRYAKLGLLFAAADPILESQLKLLLVQAQLMDNVAAENFSSLELLIDQAHHYLMVFLGGQNHPLIARFYQVLASTYWYLHHQTAFASGSATALSDINLPIMYADLQKRAVEMSVRSLGKPHPWSLRALLLLGCYSLFQGKLDDAIYSFTETLKSSSTSFSAAASQSSSVTTSTGDLPDTFIGDVYFALCEAFALKGDIAKALEYGIMAKQKKEAILGIEHPQTIQSYYQLAQLAYSLLGISEQKENEFNGVSNHLLTRDLVGGKLMTAKLTEYAQLAMQSYEKIFNFIKFQASTKNQTAPVFSTNACPSRNTLFSNAAMTADRTNLSPLQMALYSPICQAVAGTAPSHQQQQQCIIGAQGIVSPPPAYSPLKASGITDHELMSLQIQDISKKLICLELLTLPNHQRDTLRKIYRHYQAMISGNGGNANNSSSMISDLTSPSVLHPSTLEELPCQMVIRKFITYFPVTYFRALLEKFSPVASPQNGATVPPNHIPDVMAELEIMAIFAIIDSPCL